MKKSIIITGVPGTGKTTVAKLLSSSPQRRLIDINKLAIALNLCSHTDEEDGAKVVDLRSLSRELSEAIRAEESTVLSEGHLACEMKLPATKVIVLRCNPKTLRARLSNRGYSQKKIAANALSEALDYCTVLSEKNYGPKKVWEIDTTRLSPEQAADEAEKIISGKKRRKTKVSFPDALLAEAISGEKIRTALNA